MNGVSKDALPAVPLDDDRAHDERVRVYVDGPVAQGAIVDAQPLDPIGHGDLHIDEEGLLERLAEGNALGAGVAGFELDLVAIQ